MCKLSTYMAIIGRNPFLFRVYMHASVVFTAMSSFEHRNASRMVLHWQGACFRPWRERRRRQTVSPEAPFSSPWWNSLETFSPKLSLRNAVATSICCPSKICSAKIERSTLVDVIWQQMQKFLSSLFLPLVRSLELPIAPCGKAQEIRLEPVLLLACTSICMIWNSFPSARNKFPGCVLRQKSNFGVHCFFPKPRSRTRHCTFVWIWIIGIHRFKRRGRVCIPPCPWGSLSPCRFSQY